MINNQVRNTERDWRYKQQVKADLNKMEQTNKEVHRLIFVPCYSVQRQKKKTKQQNKKQSFADIGRD